MAYSHDSDRTNTPSEHEHIPSQGQSALEPVSKLAHILDNSSRDRSLAAARSESPQAGMQAYHHSAREPNGSPAINSRPKSSLSNDGSGRRASPDASQAGGQTAQRQTGDVPPGLRYSRSEAIYERSGHSDEGKAGYALWLPWEESALIDWLYEPGNRRLFNEPRRKKDCHERIIRDVLPSKTSRAIEGKIRTLEKRYQRAEAETHRPDFSTKHQGKRADEVAEALCTNYFKLHAIFNPAARQAPWHKDGPGARSPSQASTSLSVPRASPPRIASAESMPHGQQLVRKIAPKRGLDDDDTPTMLGGKRSRTFPTMALVNGRSPAQFLPAKAPLQAKQPQRSPLPLRLQQQLAPPRLYDPLGEMPARPATATSATMPIPVVSAPQPTTAPLGGSMRQAARDDEAPPAPREEIEWLQLNLRREELAFRKQALEQERVLEAQRVRLEERRLEMQAREAELESQRLLVQQKQMDVQVETLKGLTSMLHQTVASLHDVLRDLARPSQ